MENFDISENLKIFISSYIGSVGQLEVLLLVVSDPKRRWTDAQISRQLDISVGFATSRLLSLCVKGLLVADEQWPRSYAYAPSLKNDALIEELVSAHKRDPVRVASLVLSEKP